MTYRRLFTLDEANALLPKIRPKVSRLREVLEQFREEIEGSAVRPAARLAHHDLAPVLPGEEGRAGLAEILTAEVEKLIDDVNSHGCVVNGPSAGLVDFPSLINGEIVYLCWKLGEPRIMHWHRIPDGYAGRRKLLDARTRRADPVN